MMKENTASLKTFFDEKVMRYNQPSFIKDDPVCIPHLFTKQADIEIAGLFAAYLPGETEQPSSTNQKN
jgi:hypothetical protein